MSKGLPPDVLARLKPHIERYSSQAALAKAARISPAALSQMLKGETQLNATRFAQLVQELGLSVDYVMTGATAQPVTPAGMVDVPMHDIRVSAGAGRLAIEPQFASGFWPFPRKPLEELSPTVDQLHLLPVEGDSMEPTLKDGDWIMIDRSRNSWVDGLYVARYYDDLFVKRVQFEGNRVCLVSDNDNYRTIEIERSNEADIGAFELIGRVIWKGGLI